MIRTFDKEPVVCGVCQRMAHGIGYAPQQGKPILWLCQSPECTPLGKTAFHMQPKTLNTYEIMSLLDAGNEAGAYLESINKFNLTELTEEEWLEFLSIVLKNYGVKMRERLLAHQAPF